MTTRVDVLIDTVRAGRDPFDVFPWCWAPYDEDPGSEGIIVSFDGVTVGEVDGKVGALVCQLVNLAAAERYGTAVPGSRP